MKGTRLSQKGKEYQLWIAVHGNVKPTNGISDARWKAIVKHLEREYFPLRLTVNSEE